MENEVFPSYVAVHAYQGGPCQAVLGGGLGVQVLAVVVDDHPVGKDQGGGVVLVINLVQGLLGAEQNGHISVSSIRAEVTRKLI